MRLTEDKDLHRGIFWVKDIDDISGSAIHVTADCDSQGNNLGNNQMDFTSYDGLSYNHENTWKKLGSNITDNKPFDYFPRGRVEIRNGKAIIFCSPYIYSDELKNWCIDNFNLTEHNGIKKVDMKADNSSHYNCYLDNY